MSNWNKIDASNPTGTDGIVSVMVFNPNQFKDVLSTDVTSALDAVLQNIVEVSGRQKLTTNYKFLQIMKDLIVLYEDQGGTSVRLKTPLLDKEKLDVLVDAIWAVPETVIPQTTIAVP